MESIKWCWRSKGTKEEETLLVALRRYVLDTQIRHLENQMVMHQLELDFLKAEREKLTDTESCEQH